ncbi:MAG: hypothetical protein M3066_08500 [Actinomycetota bacterium]|nr:hypothetical protein [Actinomycetota bacterium]
MTAIPLQSVAFRDGAVPMSGRMTVLTEIATKENAKDDPDGAGSGLDLHTTLSVRTTVHDLGTVQHTWVDLHVFDEHDELIRSETLPLHPVGVKGGPEEYGFDGSVYRGTGASPGSVWLAPDARKVQFRLYCEVNGTVFSDGLLRQHDVPSDSVVTNPRAARPPSRRKSPSSTSALAR